MISFHCSPAPRSSPLHSLGRSLFPVRLPSTSTLRRLPLSAYTVVVTNDTSSSSSQLLRFHFRASALMEAGEPTNPQPAVRKQRPVEVTPENFSDFGQVISASPDGLDFGPHDAQLELHRGTPRFYIMHLKERKPKFSKITHHASVTQCLGSVGGDVWYLAVAKASIVDSEEVGNFSGKRVAKSRAGHYYVPPHPDDVTVFRISGPKFLKLNVGTWHAGPLFTMEAMDFYNLELSNTNVVDHTTHNFAAEDGVIFTIEV